MKLFNESIARVFHYFDPIFLTNFGEFPSFLCIFNCSQTKFVAIILVLSVFFYAIFRLTNFRLIFLTFRPQKRDKQVAPSAH